MKKWLVTLALLLTTMVLAACGESDGTAEEVYTKALEASEEMESAEVDMEMTQEMMIPGETESMTMESEMAGSMVMEPLAMHQKGVISIDMGEMSDVPMEMEQEIYLVDNEMYMFDSMSNQWMKMDDSMIPMEALNSQQMDASEQLSMLEEYMKELNFEEAEDEYVLNLSADGEGIKEMSKELINDVIPEDITAQLGEDVSKVLENMEITTLTFDISIDKDTYQMTNYNMNMDMTIAQDGEEMNIKQEVKTTYKNINTIDHIEVPQEVKDSAVDGLGLE
ncbi:DUF6612 family protein [Oceanobacillus halophilus]|uniref:LppX_LprAFG lipoprotein n=1 Tax=Oceanobacillus halophilus TaxID=930130 RepID=A0A494ZXV2_9BACI|nr:DUF6612 family protein [Oceanobacillus halophilus]RKQ31345.1 hypothetical protein D8M06_13870 [Oceanobacillus halophilus]